MNRPLIWYVTPHGYGHATRSCTVIQAFAERHPDIPVTLCSAHPETFLRNRLPPEVRVRPVALDLGLVMQDSIRIDFEASLRRLHEMETRRPALVQSESAFLKSSRAGLVAADIPPAAFEAAADAGVRSVGLGNFTWGWVYRHYATSDARWTAAAESARRGCARADRLLRYPAHEPMSDFRRILDTPVPAATGRNRRDEMAAHYKIDPAARWVLMSFQSLHLPPAALQRMSKARDLHWITVRPLEWPGQPGFTAVDRSHFPFADVLASSDVVLTKPGHGILCECLAARRPMVCVERTDWPENAVLMESVRRYLPFSSMTTGALLDGHAPAGVLAALDAPAPPDDPPPADPGAIAELLFREWQIGVTGIA